MANNGRRIFSVKEITREIKGVVEGSMALRSVCVRGEISTFTKKPSAWDENVNYLYFSLVDGKVPLSCVMFEGVDDLLEELEARGVTLGVGTSVVCEGNIEVYEPFGKYQMKCFALSEDGAGASAAALEALKERLLDEGLFAQNRPLPKFPKKIAVVTSKTGAVVHDIETTVARRYPITELVVIPATVQGANAVPSLIAGLQRAQTTGADVIIFGRGGGSNEDLDCFNDERLARAIFASQIPTISAVGHQINSTIADLAADRSAATPTAAAELAVPDIAAVVQNINAYENHAAKEMKLCLTQSETKLLGLMNRVQLSSPRGKINAWSSRLESIEARIKPQIHKTLDKCEHELDLNIKTIESVSPLAVLSRGYSVATKDGKAIKSSAELSVGDTLDIKLDKGEISARVTNIRN